MSSDKFVRVPEFDDRLQKTLDFRRKVFESEVESKLISSLEEINSLAPISNIELESSNVGLDYKDCILRVEGENFKLDLLLLVVQVENHSTPHMKYTCRFSNVYINGEKLTKTSKTRIIEALSEL